MSAEGIRIGVGTRVLHDGQLWEVTELHPGPTGTEVVPRRHGRHSESSGSVCASCSTAIGPACTGRAPARTPMTCSTRPTWVPSALSEPEREALRQRAADIREVLTGYRCGTAEFAQPVNPTRL